MGKQATDWIVRLQLILVCLITQGIGLNPVHALPGQSAEEVAAWIAAHPTLAPAPGETLLVRRSDTPAHRFTFQALTTSPGSISTFTNPNQIRMEEISLVDLINGVSRDRMEEALRIIYGEEIYQDYSQGTSIHIYPSPDRMISGSATLLGELRQGDRFAYWVELIQSPDGSVQSGRISILLIDDVPGVEAIVRDR